MSVDEGEGGHPWRRPPSPHPVQTAPLGFTMGALNSIQASLLFVSSFILGTSLAKVGSSSACASCGACCCPHPTTPKSHPTHVCTWAECSLACPAAWHLCRAPGPAERWWGGGRASRLS